MSPPTASIAWAMSRALREGVPLKSRCSRKCDAPARRSGSSTEPVPTQKPRLTDKTSGMLSVTTVRPPSRTVVFMASLSFVGLGTPARWRARVAARPLPLSLPTPRPLVAVPARVAARAFGFARAVAGLPSASRAWDERLRRALWAEVPESRAGLFLPGVLERDSFVARPFGGRWSGRSVGDKRERNAPRRVNFVHTYLELVAEGHDVFHPLDPLAAGQLRKFGDVHEAVAARQDVDKSTELGDVYDLAPVSVTYLRLRGVEHELYASEGLLYLAAVTSADGHRPDHSVVVDAYLCPGLLLDRIDHLALRADDFSYLVQRYLEGDDFWRRLAHFRPRLGDHRLHELQYLDARLASLAKRVS